MKYLLALIPVLTACQALPLIVKEAEEIAVEEAVQLEVRKEKGALNVSLDVKKEPTPEIHKEEQDAR